MAWAVIGDLASATTTGQPNAALAQLFGAGLEVVGSGGPSQGNDRRMLEQQQMIENLALLPLANKLLLKFFGLAVVEVFPTTKGAGDQSRLSGNSWRNFLMQAMNWSAVAPSITRWSNDRARYIMWRMAMASSSVTTGRLVMVPEPRMATWG